MNYIYWTLDILLVVFILKTAFLLLFSFLHLINEKKFTGKLSNYRPKVSVLIPAFNEELTISNCIKSIVAQTYNYFEVIVIDDGSTDSTNKIIKELQKNLGNLKLVTKNNGGKSSALNQGVLNANGTIIVCVDADTVLHPQTIEEMVNAFSDPDVSAVSGNVKVANSENFWGVSQALEYVNSLAIQRRAFAFFKTTHVIPGAIGGFRKYKLMEAGLFSNDTLVEDMDLTMKLASQGDKIEFCPKAIAYTETPSSIKSLYKQRYRWSYGTWQVLRKYKGQMLQSSLLFSTLLYPYLLVFSFIEVLTSITFILLFILSAYLGIIHYFLLYLILFIFLRFILSLYSTYNLNDSKFLTFFTIQEFLFYNHIVSTISLKTFIDVLINKSAVWNSTPRMGKNILSTNY